MCQCSGLVPPVGWEYQQSGVGIIILKLTLDWWCGGALACLTCAQAAWDRFPLGDSVDVGRTGCLSRHVPTDQFRVLSAFCPKLAGVGSSDPYMTPQTCYG